MTIEEIKRFKEAYKFQIKPQEAKMLTDVIKKDSNVLIFGVGRDSIFWNYLSDNVLFIENTKLWNDFAKLLKLQLFEVKYKTRKDQYKDLLNRPSKLNMNLPKMITDVNWDVILVDSPRGFIEGRMQSIYTACKLQKKHLFIHDYNRKIEKLYCKKYCKGNLIKTQTAMAHYEIN